ncbi:MAG: hypothetical protein SF162_12745 [bacterium]|nr:hypothetical protein [bacterium]
MSMNQPRGTGSTNPTDNTQRNAIIIVVVLAVIVIGAILLSNRNGDDAANTPTTQDDRPAGANQADDETFAQEGITLGDFVAGNALDRDSCVTQTTNTFNADDLIYVGLQNSLIPANTPVFVRLYRDDLIVEDTEEVTSPEDFEGCVWFEFSAEARAEVLESGSYEAEVFVNSRPADVVSFSVR